MEYRKFDSVYVIRFDPGEEIVASIAAFAEREDVQLASVQAIGAVNEFTVGVFDTGEKAYYANEFHGAYEITSLLGNISAMDGKPYVHLHMNAADRKGCVVGGHLNRAVVSATCEMVVTRVSGQLGRQFSDAVGLNLFKF